MQKWSFCFKSWYLLLRENEECWKNGVSVSICIKGILGIKTWWQNEQHKRTYLYITYTFNHVIHTFTPVLIVVFNTFTPVFIQYRPVSFNLHAVFFVLIECFSWTFKIQYLCFKFVRKSFYILYCLCLFTYYELIFITFLIFLLCFNRIHYWHRNRQLNEINITAIMTDNLSMKTCDKGNVDYSSVVGTPVWGIGILNMTLIGNHKLLLMKKYTVYTVI